jgi:hypothetical protein
MERTFCTFFLHFSVPYFPFFWHKIFLKFPYVLFHVNFSSTQHAPSRALPLLWIFALSCILSDIVGILLGYFSIAIISEFWLSCFHCLGFDFSFFVFSLRFYTWLSLEKRRKERFPWQNGGSRSWISVSYLDWCLCEPYGMVWTRGGVVLCPLDVFIFIVA